MEFTKSKRNVSLVLGGGGARGLTQIGVMKFLDECGYQVSEVVGCSIGALVGAAVVCGRTNELSDWMELLTKREIIRLMDFANPKFGLFKGDRILERLPAVFSDVNIEDLPVQYTAVAADLIAEEEVLFRTGSIYAAIRASIAIPGIFTGVLDNGRLLVDGGVLNNVPVNHVQQTDNLVIAVNLDGPPIHKDERMHKLNSFGLLQESYYVMRRKMSAMNLENYKPDYTISVPQDSAGMLEFYRSAELIEQGYILAKESIEG